MTLPVARRRYNELVRLIQEKDKYRLERNHYRLEKNHYHLEKNHYRLENWC